MIRTCETKTTHAGIKSSEDLNTFKISSRLNMPHTAVVPVKLLSLGDAGAELWTLLLSQCTETFKKM